MMWSWKQLKLVNRARRESADVAFPFFMPKCAIILKNVEGGFYEV